MEERMMNAHAVYEILLSIAGKGILTSELCRELPDEIFRDPGLVRTVAESAAMLGFRAMPVSPRKTATQAEVKTLALHRRVDTASKTERDHFVFSEEAKASDWGDEDETSLYLRNDTDDDVWTDEVLGSFSPTLAQYSRELRKFPVFTKDEERKKFEELQGCHDELLPSSVTLWMRTLADMPNVEEGALQWEMIHKVSSFLHYAGQDIPDILKEEYLRWLSLYDHAEALRGEIVQHNLRFVVTVAAKYRGRGMDFLDLIQEGNKGLMRAVDKFEYVRDLRFLTYATFWIRQAITRALSEQRRTIRVPNHIDADIKKYLDAVEVFGLQYGRSPTENELTLYLEMTPQHVHTIAEAVLLGTTVPLDRPIRQGEADTIALLVTDPKSPDPVDAAMARDVPLWMKLGLGSLTEKERTIITLRGHTGEAPHSLEEIGAHFKFSRERARQIERQALEKLRRYYRRYGEKD